MMSLVVASIVAAAPASVTPPPDAAPFAGMYDGGRMEMAAGLELRPDGRFRYGLSYGAVDEQAEGSWTVERGSVLLTSDPFEAPRFTVLEQDAGPPGKVRLRLDVPDGLPVQLFDVQLQASNGPLQAHSLGSAEEEFGYQGATPPTLWLTLPMFEVRSGPIDLATGARVRVRFEPNELGKVAFDGTPLMREGEDLLLERHGETVRFRRVEK